MSNEAIASRFDRLRGRMLGLIESWGLAPQQERGAKQTLKSLSYDMEAELKEIFAALEHRISELEALSTHHSQSSN